MKIRTYFDSGPWVSFGLHGSYRLRMLIVQFIVLTLVIEGRPSDEGIRWAEQEEGENE